MYHKQMMLICYDSSWINLLFWISYNAFCINFSVKLSHVAAWQIISQSHSIILIARLCHLLAFFSLHGYIYTKWHSFSNSLYALSMYHHLIVTRKVPLARLHLTALCYHSLSSSEIPGDKTHIFIIMLDKYVK